MSSIRLFILGSLETDGEMHGHQLRQLAEKQRVDLWTDITVGGLYGALKRLAAEELIDEVRVEREGFYPARQVWAITDAGRTALTELRDLGLTTIVLKTDPFDLAMTRADPERFDELPAIIAGRISELRRRLDDTERHHAAAASYLSGTRLFLMTHRMSRLRAEIDWHEDLAATLPELISDITSHIKTDEKSRKDT